MKNLKTIMTTLMMCLMAMVLITSCEKGNLDKENLDIKDCNCGIIANDGIDNGCFWLEIRNDCSGNKKKFCFDQDIWMSSYVGTHFCVAGVPQW